VGDTLLNVGWKSGIPTPQLKKMKDPEVTIKDLAELNKIERKMIDTHEAILKGIEGLQDALLEHQNWLRRMLGLEEEEEDE
jgi:hypothetical protein